MIYGWIALLYTHSRELQMIYLSQQGRSFSLRLYSDLKSRSQLNIAILAAPEFSADQQKGHVNMSMLHMHFWHMSKCAYHVVQSQNKIGRQASRVLHLLNHLEWLSALSFEECRFSSPSGVPPWRPENQGASFKFERRPSSSLLWVFFWNMWNAIAVIAYYAYLLIQVLNLWASKAKIIPTLFAYLELTN